MSNKPTAKHPNMSGEQTTKRSGASSRPTSPPRKAWKTISVLLVVAWMTMVFVMSAFPAETSDQQSGVVVDLVKNVFNVTPAQPELYDNLTTIVRKSGHSFEYFVLGILMTNLVCQFWSRRWYLALVFTIFYAATDEIHQAFVPGRSCELRDVLIDAIAASVGVGLTMLIRVIIRRRQASHNTTKKSQPSLSE